MTIHLPGRAPTRAGSRSRSICATCVRGEMTHRLEIPVVYGDRRAFTEACRYEDGTDVLSMATAELDDQGRIIRQLAVTAWGS